MSFRYGTSLPDSWNGGLYPAVRSRLSDRLLRRIRVGLGIIGESDGVTLFHKYDHDRYYSVGPCHGFYNLTILPSGRKRAANLAATTQN